MRASNLQEELELSGSLRDKYAEAQELLRTQGGEHQREREGMQREIDLLRKQLDDTQQEMQKHQQLHTVLDSLGSSGAFDALTQFSQIGGRMHAERRSNARSPSTGQEIADPSTIPY